MYCYFSKYRRIRRLSKAQMKKDKFLQYDFTYYEFMNAVEKFGSSGFVVHKKESF